MIYTYTSICLGAGRVKSFWLSSGGVPLGVAGLRGCRGRLGAVCLTGGSLPLRTPAIQGSGFRVQGSGFRVQGARFRVQGSGFRVQDSGLRIQD